MTVNGKGNYKDSAEGSFAIKSAPVTPPDNDDQDQLTDTEQLTDKDKQTDSDQITDKKDEPVEDTVKIDRTKQKGKDGTYYGKGASMEAADKAITSLNSEKDPKGTVFSALKLKQSTVTNNSIKVSWSKVKNAKKYVVYANVCGKTKLKKVKTGTGTSYTLKKVNKKALKKGKYYKFMVVALDKNNDVITASKIVHIATTGGSFTNAKSMTTKAKKDKVTIKKGKTFKLGVKIKMDSSKLKTKTHRGTVYETSDTKIATVSSKGVIKAKKKGTCYVYVYAQNGLYKKIKVTVK